MNGNGKLGRTRPWVWLALAVALAWGTVSVTRAQEQPPAGVVVDSSGLWWLSTGWPSTWPEARLEAESCAHGGYDDWRLPTVAELFGACEDGTIPAWLLENGWVWHEYGWGWTGSGNFWSSESKGKNLAWCVRVWLSNEAGWEWTASALSQTSLHPAFFVRGRLAPDSKKPKK